MDHSDPSGFDDRFQHLAVLADRVAYRILGDRQEAEDVTQEVLAKAFVRWHRISPHAEAWVCRVAANQALGVVRRRRTASRSTGGDGRRPAPPEVLDPAAADRMELVALLRRLPRRQREVLVLRYLADLSEADVADRMGISRGSVKRHVHRATRALRPHLEDRLAIEGEL